MFLNLIRSWGPVLIWASLIFIMSSIGSVPSAEIIWWDFIIKKLAHIFEFAVLYYLLVRALKGHRHPLHLAFFITLIYAITDELHQSFTPGRFPSPLDVGFDSFGPLIVYLRKIRYI